MYGTIDASFSISYLHKETSCPILVFFYSRLTTHYSLPYSLLTSFKKLLPCKITPPKFSATVCPISASVERTPRFTPAPPPGEYARIGTYSREWSVVGHRESGSHPWSAVIINKSEGRSSAR